MGKPFSWACKVNRQNAVDFAIEIDELKGVLLRIKRGITELQLRPLGLQSVKMMVLCADLVDQGLKGRLESSSPIPPFRCRNLSSKTSAIYFSGRTNFMIVKEKKTRMCRGETPACRKMREICLG